MYTTQANVESRLQASLSAEQAAYFDGVLDAGVDAQINHLTGTQFGSTDIVDVYVETPDDSSTLVIPTMHDITSVSYVASDGSETALAVDTYYLYPRGEANKYAIINTGGEWNSDLQGAYKITGELGYKEVPDDIVQLATEMAFNGVTAQANNIKSEKVGDWSVSYGDPKNLTPDSLMTLARYKRLSRSI